MISELFINNFYITKKNCVYFSYPWENVYLIYNLLCMMIDLKKIYLFNFRFDSMTLSRIEMSNKFMILIWSSLTLFGIDI